MKVAWVLILMVFSAGIGHAQEKIVEKEKAQIRILNLLPYLVHPPLVEPCLPDDFVLGKKEEDPYFADGYYWGNENAINEFFLDSSTLKTCLIQAQISKTTTQIALDKFSSDGKANDLVATGLSEVKVNRGKWGIFPYREFIAKDIKGRNHYQLLVGLNAEGGVTLSLQFIYPGYLNEPTQSQKLVWKNFVQKTSLLELQDLLLVRGVKRYTESDELGDKVKILVEKRKWDQKLFFVAEFFEKQITLKIEGIKDLDMIAGQFNAPYIEIDALVFEGERVLSDKIRVLYDVVDEFSFDSRMLNIDRFHEEDQFLIFQ